MGAFTGTFALAGLVGPLLGGLIVDADGLGWRWIYSLNLPIGLITLLFIGRYLKLPRPTKTVKIDWEGALYLSMGAGGLLVAASIGGDDVAWTSPTILGLFAIGLFFSFLFIWQELRAQEPILPLRLFGNDIFRVGMALAFVSGAAVMGSNIFLPLFLQVVSGASGAWMAAPWVILNGIGLGLMMPPLSIAVQNGVSLRDLGVARSANTFFRTLGMTTGVAALGAIMAARLRSELAERLPKDQVADLDIAELTGSPENHSRVAPRRADTGDRVRRLARLGQ